MKSILLEALSTTEAISPVTSSVRLSCGGGWAEGAGPPVYQVL